MSNDLSIATDKNAERDFEYVVRLTCLTLLLTLSMEWRIFLPGFRHPLLTAVPLYGPLATLPPAVDWGIFLLCMILLVGLLMTPQKRLLAFGVSASLIFLSLQDITRFQPWFHMYCFVTLVAAFCQQPRYGLDALRIMICGVYFWAGFHKLNLTFFNNIMPWFLAPIYHPSLDWLFKLMTWMAPVFEASIGILLLFRPWRFLATIMAFTMMVIVFICLGPYGHHWGKVIPLWNIWLFLMELRLFLSPIQQESGSLSLFPFKLQTLGKMSVAMFIIAPALAIFIPGYARLGFKVFSGNTPTATIILAPNETLAEQPHLFKGLLKRNRRLSFKMPVYHSTYAYQARAKAISPYLDYPSQTKLRVYSPPPFYSTHKEYTDMPL